MSDITLSIGEKDFTVELECIDKATGGAFDLSPYNDIKMFIKTTDYVTDIVPGGITLGTLAPAENGILTWSIVASDVPLVAGQYYGKIDFVNTQSGQTRKSFQFDLRIMRSLTS